jgi:hypothetical protein
MTCIIIDYNFVGFVEQLVEERNQLGISPLLSNRLLDFVQVSDRSQFALLVVAQQLLHQRLNLHSII